MNNTKWWQEDPNAVETIIRVVNNSNVSDKDKANAMIHIGCLTGNTNLVNRAINLGAKGSDIPSPFTSNILNKMFNFENLPKQ